AVTPITATRRAAVANPTITLRFMGYLRANRVAPISSKAILARPRARGSPRHRTRRRPDSASQWGALHARAGSAGPDVAALRDRYERCSGHLLESDRLVRRSPRILQPAAGTSLLTRWTSVAHSSPGFRCRVTHAIPSGQSEKTARSSEGSPYTRARLDLVRSM